MPVFCLPWHQSTKYCTILYRVFQANFQLVRWEVGDAITAIVAASAGKRKKKKDYLLQQSIPNQSREQLGRSLKVSRFIYLAKRQFAPSLKPIQKVTYFNNPFQIKVGNIWAHHRRSAESPICQNNNLHHLSSQSRRLPGSAIHSKSE